VYLKIYENQRALSIYFTVTVNDAFIFSQPA